jgi:hypothetical protein
VDGVSDYTVTCTTEGDAVNFVVAYGDKQFVFSVKQEITVLPDTPSASAQADKGCASAVSNGYAVGGMMLLALSMAVCMRKKSDEKEN